MKTSTAKKMTVKKNQVEKKATETTADSSTKKKPITMTEVILGLTRAQLMKEAQDRGIKYFRVMNKVELIEIHNGASHDRIGEIQVEAKARWQAGMTKKEATC